MAVYFMRCKASGLIKIGHGADPWKRLRYLRSGNPSLELVAVMPGGAAEERELHRRFLVARVRGEWFAHIPELAEFVAGLPGAGQPARSTRARQPASLLGAFMRDKALLRAIAAAGGTVKLADALGVTSPAISQWVRVPTERVIDVERATSGKVKRHELRPDKYPLESAA